MAQENKQTAADEQQGIPSEQCEGAAQDGPADQAVPEPDGEEQAPEKTETERLQEQLGELGDKLLRTMAEYDNFRRRSQREKESIYPQATAATVAKFVPILDTFGRALETPCADEEFKKGVEMILHHFKETLTALGVEEFAEVGEPFNPEMHNAVMHIEEEGAGESVVAEVFQRGYRLGDRVIRHAMVKVAN